MTVHPSLSSKSKGRRKRSVLKRYERIKELLEKEKWQVGKSVFGLPKLKILHWKAKKAKKEAAAEETALPETSAATPSRAGAQAETKAAPKAKKEEKEIKR